jgi:hypothetical protein
MNALWIEMLICCWRNLQIAVLNIKLPTWAAGIKAVTHSTSKFREESNPQPQLQSNSPNIKILTNPLRQIAVRPRG